jgi:chemotaxis protein histidine kinase CheA
MTPTPFARYDSRSDTGYALCCQAKMRKALTALQADLAAAGKAPNAEAAKKPLERCAQQATEADKALTQNNTKAAAGFLQEAAKALAEARTIQGQNGQFQTTLTTVEARLAALRKLPTAKAINAKIEAVAKAVEDAKKQDQAAKGEAAMAALRLATDAAAAADKADADRRAFDTEAKRVADRTKAEVTDPKLQKTISKFTEDAAKQADAFNFSDAGKALKQAEVEIANLKLRAGMSSTPPDPKLEDIAKQMVADGGAAAVDKAIQDSLANNPDVILALASGRFGKPFALQGAGSAAEQVKSIKRICETFAKIPDDVSTNPSIKDVSHVDSTSPGGSYASGSAHIRMQGRVGAHQQDFGKNEVSPDPKTGTNMKALPADIDPDCQPKDNKKIEYLGFAAAHEVGHGVDDKRGFMASKGAGDEYGGWINYGPDCQPVADAVGNHIAAKFAGSKFYKTPESKQYTLDKLMNKPATRPEATPGTPDANALDALDKWHATASLESDPFRRQSACDAIQIGDRIYHEAYARSWVSYKAAARKKGLTGYQFRAPAEWFAELYAGWKTGKLGPKHPALKWLTEL